MFLKTCQNIVLETNTLRMSLVCMKMFYQKSIFSNKQSFLPNSEHHNILKTHVCSVQHTSLNYISLYFLYKVGRNSIAYKLHLSQSDPCSFFQNIYPFLSFFSYQKKKKHLQLQTYSGPLLSPSYKDWLLSKLPASQHPNS